MRQCEYHEMLDEDAPENRIYNGQILWYSRRNPVTERISSRCGASLCIMHASRQLLFLDVAGGTSASCLPSSHQCFKWPASNLTMSRRIKWVRSVNPWDLSLCTNQWMEIDKPMLSNDDLLQDVLMVKQLLDTDSSGSAIVRTISECDAPTIQTDAELTSSGRPFGEPSNGTPEVEQEEEEEDEPATRVPSECSDL